MNRKDLYKGFNEVDDEILERSESATEKDNNNGKQVGKTVVDPQETTEFYNMTVALWSYVNDDFQNAVFGDIPEEEQQEEHTAFADDRRNLRIESLPA